MAEEQTVGVTLARAVGNLAKAAENAQRPVDAAGYAAAAKDLAEAHAWLTVPGQDH